MQPLLQWKTLSIAYGESVFVALVIQHAMRMCHIVVYGLHGSTAFFHIISQRARLSEVRERSVIDNKMYFDIL